ncbi:hypothetical protein M407DRAFT_241467 [Tulasnella calospora MUT 4182]|uniref:Uncharacterized protein n=1 Tax=Tulasnella calospora MUT 4182 TaxID=1051891 RepID=A0A0C3QTD3_9AGAM|nr:hypothetical protein M407DRAFT_241467 [Tulasnella calospora MUT 4182]
MRYGCPRDRVSCTEIGGGGGGAVTFSTGDLPSKQQNATRPRRGWGDCNVSPPGGR